jgi:hypothetical protein
LKNQPPHLRQQLQTLPAVEKPATPPPATVENFAGS